MFTRPTSLLIGKDISRTAALVDGATMDVVEANIVEGEVVVLDKDFKVAAAAVTYAASEVLYIAEGSADTYNYTNEAGTAVTGARRILVSSPINGASVTSYLGAAYDAKSEAVITIPAISGTITAGTEYVLRLVFKDIVEHPGQFTQTYRYVAKTGDASQDIFDGLRARIAKHKGTRVAASGTTTLILTGKPIPEATSKVDQIDDFSMVEFDAFFNYVDSDYNWTEVPLASAITKVAADEGTGTWEKVRDLEKYVKSYRGVTNRIWFPVEQPDFRTVKSAEYGQIVIEHDAPYTTPNNQYTATTKLRTVIAIDNEGGTNQGVNIQTRLNAWMASLPKGFTALSIFS